MANEAKYDSRGSSSGRSETVLFIQDAASKVWFSRQRSLQTFRQMYVNAYLVERRSEVPCLFGGERRQDLSINGKKETDRQIDR